MTTKRIVWWLVFLSCALPSIYLTVALFLYPRSLGVDPIKIVLQDSGLWALRFLIASLLCSPFRRLGWKSIVRFRRMLGLYAFYYASFHLVSYLAGWIEFDWILFAEDIVKRPFIYVGMVAWVILFVLAITSPKWMVKKLRKRWVLIHKSVLLAIALAWLHLWMQSRASGAESIIYLIFVLFLYIERLYRKHAS